MVIYVVSIILWRHLSASYRNRHRWGAYVPAALLIMGFAYWWIISLGLLMFLIGLVLLIVSLLRLGWTFSSGDDLALSNPTGLASST